MTSEERWIRIENALQTVAERQADHDAQFVRINAQLERTDAYIDRNAALIEQNAAAIRDLAVHAKKTDRHVALMAQNVITLVLKVDELKDMVRRHESILQRNNKDDVQ